MANNEWIKMRVNLALEPEVISIASALGIDEFGVVGRLHALWSWADQHTTNGHARSVTKTWLDRHVDTPGFSDAMIEAGWLVSDDNGLAIPKFNEHNGQSGKARGLAYRRKQRERAICHGARVTNVTIPSRSERDLELELELEGNQSSSAVSNLNTMSVFCSGRTERTDIVRVPRTPVIQLAKALAAKAQCIRWGDQFSQAAGFILGGILSEHDVWWCAEACRQKAIHDPQAYFGTCLREKFSGKDFSYSEALKMLSCEGGWPTADDAIPAANGVPIPVPVLAGEE